MSEKGWISILLVTLLYKEPLLLKIFLTIYEAADPQIITIKSFLLDAQVQKSLKADKNEEFFVAI